MEKYEWIGRSIKGFEFSTNNSVVSYTSDMKNVIGEIGIINDTHYDLVRAKFKNGDAWWYPKEQAMEHLVEPEINIKDLVKQIQEL